MNETIEQRQGEVLDAVKVEAFLKDMIPDLEGAIAIRQFPSGHSNLTYLVTFGSRELVLRRPPLGTKAKTAHDMNREYRILSALESVYPYCPRPLVFTEDPDIMGCSFYVMERIKGIILRRDIPDSLNFSPNDITCLCENLFTVLHELHSVDYHAIGLGDFGKPKGYVKRQVLGWNKRYRAARTPDVPDCEVVMAWLEEKMPADTDKPCLIHNDFKFDNVVLDPEDPLNIIGVLDWEMATLGDPLMDLGGSLAYWIESGDPEEIQLARMSPTNVDGALTRRAVAAYYEKLSGRTMRHYDFYHCFGIFRLAVIVQQIYYRFYHGQTQDQRFQKFGFMVAILEGVTRGIVERSDL
jgi:aminoglycoside phosphotransferase (APT) family kinase protein